MKYRLSFLLMSFGCFTAGAQFIFISKKPVVSFNGLIDKYESCHLKDTIPFSYVRIIDSRYDTTVIGLYVDGYLALKDTSQPLALQHTLDKYYHSLYTPGKDTLIIQLEKLSIQDNVIRDTNFILTAGYISCKKYSGTGNTYRYIGSADTMMYDKFSYKCYAVFEHATDNVFQFEKALHHQLSKHNSYYTYLATTGALTQPELIQVQYDFFIAFHANKSNVNQAQQKAKHLISDKTIIEKLNNHFNFVKQ